MYSQNAVSVEWVVKALTLGRFAEQREAQHALGDQTIALDRDALRVQLLALLKGNYSPTSAQADSPSDAAEVRCWLLSSLGRLATDGEEPEKTLKNHVDPAYEPNPWARYWALEALIRRHPADLREICAAIVKKDHEILPRTLAVAVLAQAGDKTQCKHIRDTLAGPGGAREATQEKWAVLRALRFVYLPAAVQPICALVEKAKSDDLSYDAVVALGNVTPNTPDAEDAGLALVGLITRYRRYQFWDAMRIRAIESLGRLRIDSTAPLLLEELTDFNPAVARSAARALEAVLSPATTVARILELLLKKGDNELLRFARGLREMDDQKAVVEELGAAMLSPSAAVQGYAQRLLSEIGGASAFEKLRSLTKSTERYLDILDKADDRLRTMFEDTIVDARKGFIVVIAMDVVVFMLGIGLIGLSAYLAIREEDPFTAWSTWITGGTGVLAVLYGKFIARPRAQVEDSVQYLSGLKAVFLGYLRQLRQTDQAYTRHILDDKPLTVDETKAFNELIDKTMDGAVSHLGRKPANPTL